MNECHIEISIVIPAFNESKYLDLCIKAIKKAKQRQNQYEIIVVDNGSTDETVEIARRYNCRVIKNNKKGAASSRNAGAAAGKGKLLAFVDADCILDERWFSFLKEYFKNSDVMAVGTKISPNFINSTWVEDAVFYLNNRRATRRFETYMKVRWIGTSNMLVRKDVFERVGGFNEDLTVSEDFDLCTRLSQLGDILIDRRLFTIHARESKTLKELFNRELWRGQNSLSHWADNGFQINEATSVIIPLAFLALIVSGFLFLFFSLKTGLFLLSLGTACPIMMTLRSKKTLPNPIVFWHCIVVAGTYLLARAIAMVKEMIGGWQIDI